MNDIIIPEINGIRVKKGEISLNKEIILSAINDALKRYDIVVTEDSVKSAKKDMAELNKIKKKLKESTSNAIKAYEEPLVRFKEVVKEIESRIDETRSSIKLQVDKYESEKKKEIEKVLREYVEDIAPMYNVSPDEVDVSSFVKLSAVTASGNVSKSTAVEIENKIKDIVIKKKEDEEDRLRREAEIERIKREAIEEYKIRSGKEINKSKIDGSSVDKNLVIFTIDIAVSKDNIKSIDETREKIADKLKRCGIPVNAENIKVKGG